MKKTYINPAMEVVELMPQQAILTGSILINGGTAGNGDALAPDMGELPPGIDMGLPSFVFE